MQKLIKKGDVFYKKSNLKKHTIDIILTIYDPNKQENYEDYFILKHGSMETKSGLKKNYFTQKQYRKEKLEKLENIHLENITTETLDSL